jgi:hypothetical protein
MGYAQENRFHIDLYQDLIVYDLKRLVTKNLHK